MYALVPWGPGRVRFDGRTRSPTARSPDLVGKQTRHNSFTCPAQHARHLSNTRWRSSLIISVACCHLEAFRTVQMLDHFLTQLDRIYQRICPIFCFCLYTLCTVCRHTNIPDSDSGWRLPSNRKHHAYLQWAFHNPLAHCSQAIQ